MHSSLTIDDVLNEKIPINNTKMTFKDAYFMIASSQSIVSINNHGFGGYADKLNISFSLEQDEIILPWDNKAIKDDILDQTKTFKAYIVRIGKECGWSKPKIHLSPIMFTFNTCDVKKYDIIPLVEQIVLEYVPPYIITPNIKRGEYKSMSILDLVSVQPMQSQITDAFKLKIHEETTEANTHQEVAGSVGHSFSDGFFIVDEFGRHIYANYSPKEYERLSKIYKKRI